MQFDFCLGCTATDFQEKPELPTRMERWQERICQRPAENIRIGSTPVGRPRADRRVARRGLPGCDL